MKSTVDIFLLVDLMGKGGGNVMCCTREGEDRRLKREGEGVKEEDVWRSSEEENNESIAASVLHRT